MHQFIDADYSQLEQRILASMKMDAHPPYKPKLRWKNVVLAKTTPEGVFYLGVDMGDGDESITQYARMDALESAMHVFGFDREEAKAYIRSKEAVGAALSDKASADRAEQVKLSMKKVDWEAFVKQPVVPFEGPPADSYDKGPIQVKHGWYSPDAVTRGCTSAIWLNTEGEEVEVTCVTQDREGSSYKHLDKQYVGMVTRYVRKEW